MNRIVAIAICSLLLCIQELPAQAWYENYNQAEKALKRKEWSFATQKFTECIKEKPESNSQARNYSTIFVQYYPYLGRALANLYKREAVNAFKDLLTSKLYKENSEYYNIPSDSLDKLLFHVEKGLYDLADSLRNHDSQADGEILMKLVAEIKENFNKAADEFQAKGPNVVPLEPKYKNLIQGQFFALLIAVEKNSDSSFQPLNHPYEDALKLEKILLEHYGFKKNNVRILLNPVRDSLLHYLNQINLDASPWDHVLIFYSGHGHWDERRRMGYWTPTDAKNNETSNWISMADLRSELAIFRSKHLLLINDSCYSGSIFLDKAKKPSSGCEAYGQAKCRKAMTSGYLEPVPDKSDFFISLCNALLNNHQECITSGNLFFSFNEKIARADERVQRPQWGTIHDADDQGGDFIFLRQDRPNEP